jgi:hypothetical protein
MTAHLSISAKSGTKSFPGQVNDLLIELLISVMRSI